jgi:hypothetical protein
MTPENAGSGNLRPGAGTSDYAPREWRPAVAGGTRLA